MKLRIRALPWAVFLVLTVCSRATVAATYTLGDYAEALRMKDVQRIENFRLHVLGAVDTHLMYSKMLRDYTGFNILCPGNKPVNKKELGSILN